MQENSWADWLDYIQASGGALLTTHGSDGTNSGDPIGFGPGAIDVVDDPEGVLRGPFHLTDTMRSGVTRSHQFASRRSLIGHLRLAAVEDLRRDWMMQAGARHAVKVNDQPLVAHLLNPSAHPCPWDFQDRHRAHERLARRMFRQWGQFDLIHAARLCTEFREVAPKQQWRRRLDLARAEASAQELGKLVNALSPQRTSERTRL